MIMLFRFFIIISFILILTTVQAQLSIGGQPFGYNLNVSENNTVNNGQDTIVLAELNLTQLAIEDEEDAANGNPPRFGSPSQFNLNLTNSGIWRELDNGDRIWHLVIQGSSALSLNLLYKQFMLPENSTFFIYNSEMTQILGAFTSLNNKGTNESIGKFATGLILDNEIILEYHEPRDVIGEGVIEIDWIVQGYRYINIANFGDSGDCQVNVNCSPEGDDWQVEKNSVALILVNGFRWCTGSLINNTLQNGTPYFLSANHCLDGWALTDTLDAINNPDASYWQFYWNYESDSCANGIDFLPPSTTGATVVANNSSSDFVLFELIENPLDLKPQPDLFFNGWDRQQPERGGVGIHHPSGDIKKISTHDTIPGSSGNFWSLFWVETENGYSVTEGGSSGSPLYNSNHRVIGQLQGGSFINCSEPSEDLGRYGKFNVSWNNSTIPKRRLKDWLDPKDSDVSFIDGFVCNTLNIENSFFGQDVSFRNCYINAKDVRILAGKKLTLEAIYSINIEGDFEICKDCELDLRIR